MANQKKTEAVEPISVTTVAAPAAPSADETASQLIGILTQASPELQAQIVQKLSQSSGYNPSAVGQENPAYRKKPSPNPSSAVTDKDGDPTGKGPHAQAWLRRWHEGNSISARQMTLQGMNYGSAEDLAQAARMEFPTEGLTG